MHAVIPPLPHYVFVAWCLVKHRDNFNLLYFPFSSFSQPTFSDRFWGPRDPLCGPQHSTYFHTFWALCLDTVDTEELYHLDVCNVMSHFVANGFVDDLLFHSQKTMCDLLDFYHELAAFRVMRCYHLESFVYM